LIINIGRGRLAEFWLVARRLTSPQKVAIYSPDSRLGPNPKKLESDRQHVRFA
jgi:hypothetical protein